MQVPKGKCSSSSIPPPPPPPPVLKTRNWIDIVEEEQQEMTTQNLGISPTPSACTIPKTRYPALDPDKI